VIAPAPIALAIAEQAQDIARRIVTHLDYVGILGIEFFLTAGGELWVNELAPRTHNSGHYTLDACVTSQFAMHLQAITDRPLGDPRLKSASAVMVNLLGFETADSDYQEKRQTLAALPHTKVHWYGKSASRPGRKLGHVTQLSDSSDPQVLQESIDRIERLWYG
jgi:5-(carboxyamino)imidazole ribonucleotide synthase